MLLVYVRHDKEGLLGKEARCYLKAIFLEISQVFPIRFVFSRIFLVLPIWKLLFPGVPEFFWFEKLF